MPINEIKNLIYIKENNKLALSLKKELKKVMIKLNKLDYLKEDISKIFNKKNSNIDKDIELLLYIMKSQIFIDGNKRTAVIFANHYLIKKGLGLIVIPAELTDKHKELLISYYEGKDETKIKEFIKDFCYIKMY